jgi:hypothetical protein
MLTIAMVQATKGKVIPLPRTINQYSGKESKKTEFSDSTWGEKSRSYAKSVCTLSKGKFDVVIKEAQAYVKPTRRKAIKTKDVIDVDEDDRGCLVASNTDEDGKSSFSHSFHLTYVIF